MYFVQELLETTQPTQSHRMYGVMIAIVTNNEDPEKLGRVRVKYPWLSDSDESHWARMAVPMAGKGRGFFMMPEVDDEVLVAFEQGDTRFPYVLGALWNGKDTPPEKVRNGKNDIRMIQSRSGHVIQLNDENGKETIEIIDKTKNNKIVIDTTKNEITIASDANITLSAPKGKLTLEAQDLNFKATKATTIESKSGLDLKTDATLTCKGSLIKLN